MYIHGHIKQPPSYCRNDPIVMETRFVPMEIIALRSRWRETAAIRVCVCVCVRECVTAIHRGAIIPNRSEYIKRLYVTINIYTYTRIARGRPMRLEWFKGIAYYHQHHHHHHSRVSQDYSPHIRTYLLINVYTYTRMTIYSSYA